MPFDRQTKMFVVLDNVLIYVLVWLCPFNKSSCPNTYKYTHNSVHLDEVILVPKVIGTHNHNAKDHIMVDVRNINIWIANLYGIM